MYIEAVKKLYKYIVAQKEFHETQTREVSGIIKRERKGRGISRDSDTRSLGDHKAREEGTRDFTRLRHEKSRPSGIIKRERRGRGI